MSRGPGESLPWWLPVVVVALGAIVYGNSLSGPFFFDDLNSIVDNPHIRQLWPPWGPKDGMHNLTVHGRPALHASFALNYAVGGLEVRGYHLVNIGIHIIAALLLLGIVRRTLATGDLRQRFGSSANGLALASATIWMVHPLLTESVSYITQRSESLMGLFYFLTLYLAIRAFDSSRPDRWVAAAVAACALGMASKQVMVTAPVIVLLYDVVFRGGSPREAVRRHLALYVGLAASWAVLAGLMIAFPDTNVGFNAKVGPWTYLLNQGLVIGRYLMLVVWPVPLLIDYGFPRDLTLVAVWPHMVALALLAVVVVATLFRRPQLGFLGAWFFIILAPTSSIVPMVTEVGAERRMYLPLAGLVVLAVVVAANALRRLPPSRATRAVGPVLAAIVVLLLGWRTMARNVDYRDAVSMWKTAVALAPDNARTHFGLGNAYYAGQRLSDAYESYARALELDPIYGDIHNNLAGVLAAMGRPQEALDHVRRAVEIEPRDNDARFNLAKLLFARGDHAEAVDHFRQVASARPDDGEASAALGRSLAAAGDREGAVSVHRDFLARHPGHTETGYVLGQLLTSMDRVDEAIAMYGQVLDHAPDFAPARFKMGNLLAELGRLDAAEANFRLVAAARPEDAVVQFHLARAMLATGRKAEALPPLRRAVEIDARHVGALNALAWILATHPDPAVRSGPQALRFARAAAELTEFKDPSILDTLAAAYASAGQLDWAKTTGQAALKLANEGQMERLAETLRSRLRLYGRGQAYIDGPRVDGDDG